MNYRKAYSDIISEILKKRCDGGLPCHFDEMEGTDYVGVLPTGYYAYVFPKCGFLIEKSAMIPTTNLKRVYDRKEYAEILTWTGVIKQIKKAMVIELKSGSGKTVFINEKYVKLFGKPSDLTFKSECDLKPVYVYEKEFLIGIIMPVKGD